MSFLDELMYTQSREGSGRAYPSVPDIGSFGLGTAPDPPSTMRDVSGAPPRRVREKPTYTPHDIAGFDMLAQMAARGVSPEMLQMMAADIEGGYQSRLDAYRAKNAARRESLQSLSTLGPQAAELTASGVPPTAVDDMFQGFGGKVERGLDSIIGQVGAPSTGGAVAPLEQDMAQGIYDDAMAAARGTDESPPVPLDQARELILDRLRAMHIPEEQVRDAYNIVGSAYQAAGGDLNDRPLTYADRLQELAFDQRYGGLGGTITPGMGSYTGVTQTPSPTTQARGFQGLGTYLGRA